MTCNTCKADIAEGHHFCPKCGQPVGGKALPPPPLTPRQDTPPPPERDHRPLAGMPMPPPFEKRK